jgi:hypothetical protein
MTFDVKQLALEYLSACANKSYPQVERLLAPDVRFVSTANDVTGAQEYLAVLRRLGPIWLRSDVKRVFVEGDEVCALYDFVTDSPAGAVPIVEWLVFREGKIASVTLVFDRVAFRPASEELARRAR